MPRKAIDYRKVIIYKLVCNDLSIKDLYVGHTTDFTNRKKSHKDRCIHPNNPKYNLKVYQIMRENGSWDNEHGLDLVDITSLCHHAILPLEVSSVDAGRTVTLPVAS